MELSLPKKFSKKKDLLWRLPKFITHATVSLAAATDLSKKHSILLILFSSDERCVNYTGITSPVITEWFELEVT